MSRLSRASFRGLAMLALVGCEPRRSDPPGVASASEPSPNASVLPTPLVAGPTKAVGRDAGHAPADASADAGTPEPPRPLRENDALLPESELRAAPGLALDARLRWLDAPPPRSPEGNAEALSRARDRNAFDVSVELSSLGRLRLKLASKAFPFPTGTELRARDDRYGHILVWPGAEAYTPLPPGTLRATLAEHRVDVTPLSEATVASAGSDSMLGIATQKQRIETSIGSLELEQAVAPAAGAAGALFCRLLLELLAVAPESAACRPEWVPLRASYTWTSGERFELEVTRLTKRPELAVDDLSVPPSGAGSRQGELPGPPFMALIEERELADFHSRPLPPPAKAEPGAPKSGLVFQNHGDSPLYLLIEGVPILWLRADAEWLVSGLKPGRYTVQARNFFGAESARPRLVELPARFTVGDEAERPSR